jgi:Tol biopolymer transport system component
VTRRADTENIQIGRLTDAVGLEEFPSISPDGKSAVYVAKLGDHRQIWLRLLSGGTPLPITKDDVDHSGPRWSPDSTTIIYYTYAVESGLGQPGTIWEISALGGTPRRLTRALGPGDLSHDGKSIAFLRYHDEAIELAVAARDLSTTRIIANLPGGLYSNIRWSPDDRRIAFIRDVDTDFFSTLMVADATGGEPRVISQNSFLQGFTWLPNESGFVVSSSQGSTMPYPPASNLWTLPLDARTPPRQLTFNESSYEYPDMSPEGSLIVSRVRTQSDIWKFPVTGAPEENARGGIRITRQTGQLQTVTANPDETEVAFLSETGGHANVWAAKIADGALRQLTREFDPRFVIAVPHWSPRGDLINFLSNHNTGTAQTSLWVVTPDGGVMRDLGVLGVGVCWSADGKWLYYYNVEKGIYVIRRVSVDGGPSELVRENAKAPALAWDGSALYFSILLSNAAFGRDHEIHVAKPPNGPSQPLGRVAGSRVPSGAMNFQPVLSPNGKWLAVPLMDGATANIWALSTGGLGWRKLTDFHPRNTLITRRVAWSKDNKHIYAALAEVDSDIVMLQGVKP